MEELPFSKLIFAQLVNKFPEFLVPESLFLCLQTSAIVMYPKPHRSVLPNHQFKRTYPSSSVSAEWFRPCRYFYFVLYTLTYCMSNHMPKTFTFLFLQTPAIGLYTKPNRSIIRHHTVQCNHPSSSVSAKWILPLDISALFHIHLRTPAHATCPECLHSCFYKPLLLDCTLNQISQFSVITQFGVLVYLLLCLPSSFVLVDISTLFCMHLHTPTHATCPRYFNVLV